MEPNNDILAGLALITSPMIELPDLKNILHQCDRTLTSGQKQTTCQSNDEDKLLARNVLIFSICSLVLEAARNGMNESSLKRFLCDHLDHSTISSDSFHLLECFLASILPKVGEALKDIQLDGEERAFRDLRWSQSFEVKSSILESIREKSYVMELEVDQMVQQDNNTLHGHELKINERQQQQQQGNKKREVIEMSISQRELHDLYASLVDCVKNVEHIINK